MSTPLKQKQEALLNLLRYLHDCGDRTPLWTKTAGAFVSCEDIPPRDVPKEKAPPPMRAIEDPIKACQNLEELKNLLKSFEACPFKHAALNMVFSDGIPTGPVMCIGEAPGAEEDKLGKPFVGLSGQLLDTMLACIGLSRHKNVYITNIVPWRPPGNRTPTPQEMALFLPFVQRHIELIGPKVILLWGGTAAKTLLSPKVGIMKQRGHWHDLQTPHTSVPIPTMAFFHPAYLLRSPGQKRLVWQDLKKVRKYMDNPVPS